MIRLPGAPKAALAVSSAAILAALALLASTPVAPASGAPRLRSTALTVSPAPGDLVLETLRFPAAPRQPLGSHTLRVTFAGPHGGDYLAVAAVTHPPRGGPQALVLLVNRPTPLLDPAHVRLRVSWSRGLGGISTHTSTDALSRPSAARISALCNLTHSGKALPASVLRALPGSGAALGAFTPAGAVADGYDAACGLAYPLAFRQTVKGSPTACGKGESRSGALCCPPGAMCVPGPEPVPQPAPEPTPEPAPVEPPGCTPCNPRPGTACPLIAQPGVCRALAPSAPKGLAAATAH